MRGVRVSRIRLAVFSAASCLFAAAAANRCAAAEIAMLDSGAAPVSYNLQLTFDSRTQRFSGSESVRMRLHDTTRHISLNDDGVNISNAKLDGVPISVTMDPRIQQVHFVSALPLPAGMHTLTLDFAPSATVLGLSPAIQSYPGAPPFFATMFEPAGARKLFPCFDEPQFRAPLTLQVTAPAGWTVVSNMPVLATALTGPAERWDFAPTPAMPVYLLTVDMGPMDRVVNKSGPVPVALYASKAAFASNRSDFQRVAQNMATILRFYNRYLGVPYTLPKLDAIAAPNIVQTALEQWGAITFYSQQDLIDGSASPPERGRRYRFSVLAHEMAHQWFGDLAGMRWWNQSFVAEGLAQWLEHRAEESLRPGEAWWQDDDLDVDSLMSEPIERSTQPVNAFVNSDRSKDDASAFALAVYYKSASVLEMWQHYVGDRTFLDGVRRYLRTYAGRTATLEDFWGSLPGPESRPYGDAWLTRVGFPIVTASLRCSGTKGELHLSQTAFRNAASSPPGYAAQIWPVPVFVNQHNRKYSFLLARRSQRFTLDSCALPVLDANLRPYYRLELRGALLQRTLADVPQRSERDRSNLVRDAIALYDARKVTAAYALSVAEAAGETDPGTERSEGRMLSAFLTALPRQSAARARIAALTRRIGEGQALHMRFADMRYRAGMATPLREIGDPSLTAKCTTFLTALTSDSPAWINPWTWACARIAAQAPNAVLTAQMQKWYPPSKSPAMWLPVTAAFTYLVNVGDRGTAQSLLQIYGSDPQFVFDMAKVHPDVVWKYLSNSSRRVLRSTPPSQQSWVLARGVAQAFWDVAGGKQMRTLLERVLGPNSEFYIERALERAARLRAAGAALSAELDPSPVRAAKAAVCSPATDARRCPSGD